ncbi:MAG: hypothetical protein N3D84_04145, partial [Candidatus Woesearchaeota archaeon]|nr:hypothetical protein [Candidatus Woesearchaeota archaeon]
YNINNLAAGYYAWRMIANDTSGNYNATEQYTYTVQKASTTTHLYLNGTENNVSINYPDSINVTATTDAVNVTLYRNGTIVNASSSTLATYFAQLDLGHYNFTAVNPGNENYTGSSKTLWLNVTQGTTTTYLYINGTRENRTFQYPAQVNLTGVTNYLNVSLYIDGTLVNASSSTTAYYNALLAAGYYNITAVNKGNGYSGSYETFWLNITKADSSVSLYINGTSNNYTINASDSINITGILNSGEDHLTLYENGTIINSGSSPLYTTRQYNTIGLYNLTLVYNETQNYTSSYQTLWLNVTDKVQPTPSNPTEYPSDPATYSPSQLYQFNITWTDNVAIDTVIIEHNFTGVLQNYTVTGNDGDIYYYNINNLAAGYYAWRMIANDTRGNYNA